MAAVALPGDREGHLEDVRLPAEPPAPCASVLLDAGESVRALAEYLGHADPGFTLRVYTHLMPASEERTNRAVDHVFGGGVPTPLSTACAPNVHQGGS